MKPIRIFLGTEPKTLIAEKVLAHSIRRNTGAAVEITPMIGPAWEYPTEGIKVGTGFSLRRWMIPYACRWDGHAIYMDADQVVFGDVEELYALGRELLPAEPNAPVLACTFQPDKYNKKPAPQTSVMVIDCWRAHSYWQFHGEKVLDHLRANGTKEKYAAFMHAEGLPVAEPLPVEWNHLNVYKHGVTKLLHYTKEPEQPWTTPSHPLAKHWRYALIETIKAGEIRKEDFEAALAKFGVKEDWRPKNGLHPAYRDCLKFF